MRVPAQRVRWAVTPALFLLVFSRVMALPKYAPDVLLDGSYAAALTYFRSNGLQFGADALYSFGPLGYIITGVFTGYAWLAQFIGAFVLAAFISLLFSLAATHLPRTAGVLLIFAVIFAGPTDATYLAVPAVVYTYLLTSHRSGNGILIVTALGMALIALIKFTFFAAVLAVVPGIVILLWSQQKQFRAGLWATFFLAAYTILWGSFGGGLRAFGLYLRGSFEVSAGYAQTMYVLPMPLQLYCGLGCLALCGVIAGILFAVKASAVSRMNLLIWGVGLFLAWKHSFVRADNAHLRSFFCFLPFFLAGVFAESFPALKVRYTVCRRAVAHVASLPVLCLAIVALSVSDPTKITRMRPDFFLVDAWQGLRDAVQVGTRYRALRESVAAQARQYDLAELKAVIGSNAVDVFGQGQSLAILNGLQYRPRPAFQSFESYTPYLIRRNYDYYVTSPPPFVLFKLGTVDGRYPAQEDSLALASILTNYTPVGEKFDHLLLRRLGSVAVEGEMKLIDEREASVGEDVEIPDRKGAPIWCAIQLRIGPLSRLRALLYQPEDVGIRIESTTGRVAQYRYLSGAGETGFIINPLLDDQNAVSEYLCGITGNRSRQFRIFAGSNVKQALIRFYTLRRPLSVGLASICRDITFPMLGITPRVIEGVHGPTEVDGKTRLLVHAPGKLRFDVPRGARWLVGEYGLMRGAYENGGATDGVVFRALGDRGNGTMQPLWESWLRPVSTPTDRGIHRFRVELPEGVDGLMLQTDVGPNGNGNWDWSVWSDVNFVGTGKTHTGEREHRETGPLK